MKNLNIFLLILLTAVKLLGQNQDPFLPANMGPGINTKYNEINPVISPDGKTLYFVRANHPQNNYGSISSQDIWTAALNEDGTFGEPVRIPFPLNAGRFNAIYGISADGSTIYINGSYSKKMKWKKRGISTVSKLGPLNFSTPKTVDIRGFSKLSKGRFGTVYVNETENTMFLSFSRKYDRTKNDIYVSRKSSKGYWSRPKKLNKSVNTKYSEITPVLSRDGSKLIFASNRKNGKGSFDIYISERKDESYHNWSEPKKINDTVNSKDWEAYYTLNAKGSWAYFASNASGEGASDIFRIKLFEENPFVLVKGKVLNKRTEGPLPSDKSVILEVNGQPVDSVRIDPETGNFNIKLPLGASYSIRAVTENFNSVPEVVDVTRVREYKEVQKALYVESIPFVLITGKIIPTGAGDTAKIVNPKILVDDFAADSVTIDSDNNYRLKLKFGQKYELKAKAEGFKSESQLVDFTNIKEYREVKQDLYINKIVAPKAKEAVISGKIINSKTRKGISGDSAGIQVNEKLVSGEIKDSTYKISLPLGEKYIINASVKNFYPVYETIDLVKATESLKISKDLFIAPIEVGASIKLNNIFFETGKSTLKPTSFPELERVIKFLNENSTLKIEIAGHTDNVGNAATNKNLSQARANAVANYIIKNGVAKDRIVAKGYGMEKPVASNKTAAGKSQNRRVEFTILDK
jgi:outer membrane protein OmpA-like peptidoglycan-associated protein